MASYTIEDIEMIRRKSGISYQEAVALLDYHNGNVARALIDLERNGRILSEAEQSRRAAEKKNDADSRSGKQEKSSFIQRLYRTRLKVNKGDITIANLSALFCGACILFSPHMTIAAVIAALVLGYKIHVERDAAEFRGENIEKMVRNAADNVKSSVGDIARGFADLEANAAKQKAEEEAEKADEKKAAPAGESRSFYQTNPAATTAHAAYAGTAAVPTIQVPVKVESQDGDVTVESENDGHSSATIG